MLEAGHFQHYERGLYYLCVVCGLFGGFLSPFFFFFFFKKRLLFLKEALFLRDLLPAACVRGCVSESCVQVLRAA